MLARFYDLYFKIAFYIVNNYIYFFEKRLTPGFWKIKTKIHQQTTFIYMQQLVHYNKCCRRKVRLMNLLLALGWIFFILNQNKKKKTLITSLFNLRKKIISSWLFTLHTNLFVRNCTTDLYTELTFCRFPSCTRSATWTHF